MKPFFYLSSIILGLSLIWLSPHQLLAEERPALIYYNEACGACAAYLNQDLTPFLEKEGFKVSRRDYINEKTARRELNDLNNRLNVPFELQSHIMVFLDQGKTILGGHVPLTLAKEILEKRSKISAAALLVFQDTMIGAGHGTPDDVTYTVWTPERKALSFPLQTSFEEYLKNYGQNGEKATVPAKKSLLGLILVSGFLDGFNPCAFAVLIFFIAFLFALQRRLTSIFLYGVIYIVVIYLTYLGIGLGLFKAVVISSVPHLMARVGAWLLIVLSLVQIKDYFWPRLPVHLRMFKFSQNTVKNWLTKATLPAVIVGAFLVGLCTFPCSGGIYVATIGLLASRETFWSGLVYLLIYNIMFVLPLIILLLLAANRFALAKVAVWQTGHEGKFKLVFGLLMLGLGLIFLFI